MQGTRLRIQIYQRRASFHFSLQKEETRLLACFGRVWDERTLYWKEGEKVDHHTQEVFAPYWPCCSILECWTLNLISDLSLIAVSVRASRKAVWCVWSGSSGITKKGQHINNDKAHRACAKFSAQLTWQRGKGTEASSLFLIIFPTVSTRTLFLSSELMLPLHK